MESTLVPQSSSGKTELKQSGRVVEMGNKQTNKNQKKPKK